MEPRYNEGLRLTYTVRGSLYRDSTVSGEYDRSEKLLRNTCPVCDVVFYFFGSRPTLKVGCEKAP